jgi:ABC-type multidrug transport system ATPase subunit
MLIQLHSAGKRFNRDWIFRNVNTSFSSGNAYAITGPNGSGKSTLLQVIAAALQTNEGKIDWQLKAQNELITLSEDEVHSQIAICAPYLEVIEEMTATEFLNFHASFKPLLPHVSITEIINIVGLQKAGNKQIRFYSSGMKQRIKLAQAIFADVPGLLLDEPCTNLDASGYELYHKLIEDYCRHKLVVVSSNDINEYDFCTERISILNYKQAVKA